MFFEDRLSLVTGGSGFVGTHIVKALLGQGARVRIPVHERAPLVTDPRIETVQADLSRQDDCGAVMKGVDFVFHAAGSVGAAGLAASSAMGSITGNLVLTSQVLQAAWTAQVERILIFGSSTGYPVSEHPIREEEMWSGPVHPSYLGYGWMRRYLERMAEFVASRSAVQVALVRPTAIYGRYDNFRPDTSHVIPALVRKAVDKMNPFEVWGTGEEVRDFLHVEDLARGCLLTMEKHAVCDPVNIGYGAGVTVRRLVEIILGAAGHGGAEVRFDAAKPTTIPVRVVDTSKAKRLLGFTPAIALEDGLRDLVQWYAAAPRQSLPA
ncbi:MAG: GDP-L-fucose synthase [Alphaproteobacteria bacterium]|jgi:GDP-L-fucose synthase|nr:GDP-L-fucose synthase [Alphaproteobacteria bacterium]